VSHDAINDLLAALTEGNRDDIRTAAYDILSLVPSPVRGVSMTAYQVKQLAELLVALIRLGGEEELLE
jgi:hypothetical protein